MSRPVKSINHGTYGGYQAHLRRGEEACDLCLAAGRVYRRIVRADPKAYTLHRERMNARNTALKELGQRYRDEYEAIYTRELKALRESRHLANGGQS